VTAWITGGNEFLSAFPRSTDLAGVTPILTLDSSLIGLLESLGQFWAIQIPPREPFRRVAKATLPQNQHEQHNLDDSLPFAEKGLEALAPHHDLESIDTRDASKFQCKDIAGECPFGRAPSTRESP
jgi:hypothetical protein